MSWRLHSKKLPIVLRREDMIRIFESVNNLKHKAILIPTYSAALRVSEVVKLRVQDIDARRNMIQIKRTKRRKDRYTILSKLLYKNQGDIGENTNLINGSFQG